jgi:hypothetical protein
VKQTVAILAMLIGGAAQADGLDGPAKVRDFVAQCSDAVKEEDRDKLGCSSALLAARLNAAMTGAAVLCEPHDINEERVALIQWLAGRPDLQDKSAAAGLRMGLVELYTCH